METFFQLTFVLNPPGIPVAYDALFPSDDIWLQTDNPGFFNNAFVQFAFQTGLSAASLPLVESIFFSVEGRQGDPDTDDWYIYLWDFSQSQYLRLSSKWDKDPDEVQAQTVTAGYVSTNGYTVGAARGSSSSGLARYSSRKVDIQGSGAFRGFRTR